MATYRKPLLDKNGNTIVPAMPEGHITGTDIADDTITPDNMDWSEFQDSSTERVVGTWYDGKPIYRRVIAGTVAITAGTAAIVSTNIAAKSLIRATGWYESWKSSTTSNKIAFGHYMGTNIYSYALIRNATNIELGFMSSANVSSSNYEVVVEYTKP